MILGAVVSVLQTLLLFTEIDLLREVMYESAATSDPAFDESGFETFVDIMVVVVLVASCLFALVVVGIWTWMALANARGRAWARITATVLGAVNVTMCLINLAFLPLQEVAPEVVGPNAGTSMLGVLLTVVYLIVSVVAVVLLWLPASTAYVRDTRAQTEWERWARRFGQPPGQ